MYVLLKAYSIITFSSYAFVGFWSVVEGKEEEVTSCCFHCWRWKYWKKVEFCIPVFFYCLWHFNDMPNSVIIMTLIESSTRLLVARPLAEASWNQAYLWEHAEYDQSNDAQLISLTSKMEVGVITTQLPLSSSLFRNQFVDYGCILQCQR